MKSSNANNRVSDPSLTHHAATPCSPAGAVGGSSWLSVPQPRLGTAGLVALLALANAICPFSLDMYTPAVPLMPAQFDTTAAMVNLTISGFYLFFAIGMLLFGPICDRTGRKPVLVGGLATFTLGSILCSLAWSVEALIAFRVIEALGAGAICAVSTAIVKDCFRPEKRTTLLSILQILMVIGPVAAPLIGGFILRFSTWHATFSTLAVIGVACLVLSLLYKESLPAQDRTRGGLANTFVRMGAVAKNRGFSVLLLVASLFSVPFMAYVAVASYVYTGDFGISTQGYTYLFAATAAISALGPVLYLRASKSSVTPRAFTHAVIVASLVVAVALIAFAQASVWAFFACFVVFALAEASVRPYTTNILLAQNDRDAGSASALINFSVNIFGVAGMGLISLWRVEAYVEGLGIVLLASMVLAALLWIYLLKSKKAHIKELE